MGEYADYRIENYTSGRWGQPLRQKRKPINSAEAFNPSKNRGFAGNFTKAKDQKDA